MNFKKTVLISIAIIFAASATANAAVMFTFAGQEDQGDDTKITELCTAVYGAKVVLDDVEIRDNDDLNLPYWESKENWNNFLRCDDPSGDFELHFVNKQISRAYGEACAFRIEDSSVPDFAVYGYDKTFGNYEDPNPDALVGMQELYTGEDNDCWFDVTFDRPVTLLVFAGHGLDEDGYQNIGIDNLCVQPVPAPGALLLGALGTSFVGWMKRRRMVA